MFLQFTNQNNRDERLVRDGTLNAVGLRDSLDMFSFQILICVSPFKHVYVVAVAILRKFLFILLYFFDLRQ